MAEFEDDDGPFNPGYEYTRTIGRIEALYDAEFGNAAAYVAERGDSTDVAQRLWSVLIFAGTFEPFDEDQIVSVYNGSGIMMIVGRRLDNGQRYARVLLQGDAGRVEREYQLAPVVEPKGLTQDTAAQDALLERILAQEVRFSLHAAEEISHGIPGVEEGTTPGG